MAEQGERLCLLQGRIGRPMACFSRSLGHWPKDGPAALADGRRSSRLFSVALQYEPRYEALVTRGEEEVVVMH